MKALHNHLILFDDECPVCDRFTKAVIKTGLLDGRSAYQQLPKDSCPMVDRQRAADEIALVDLETGEVTYGIKSLFKILANAKPALKSVLEFAPLVWLMTKVYAFAALNRRVIIPIDTNNTNLQPMFKLHYRLAYLIFTWALASYILTQYTVLLAGMVYVGSSYREYLICGGQIVFQGIVISLVDTGKRWDYLGNMMTISFAGALALLPMLLLAHWIGAQPIIYTGYFLCVAGLMLLEHIRRSKLLHIGWALTISWALYRAIVLLLILLN